MTWYEIKLATLKKIDPAITSLVPTRNTKDYLNAMVPVANRGLQDLATAGKYIEKHYDIMIPELTNVLDQDTGVVQHVNSDIEVNGGPAYAYYFEMAGRGTVNIYAGNTLVRTVKNEQRAGWEIFKGKISNADKKSVRIVFSGSYPYQFRNVALYDVQFEEDTDVWEYNEKVRFDLRKLTDDFYRLVTFDVVLESGTNPYSKYHEYMWEGDSTLILNGKVPGNYKVHYYSYPREITEDTPDDYVLELDPEVAALLPIYMASELYEDDDTSTAYYFRQQYEEAKNRLVTYTAPQGRAEFEDVWGWM